MATADYIPTGRTSLVKQGTIAFQIQTEYAHRPTPRLTTTVLNSGQVVHKIERQLDQPISSIEEKNRMEISIRKQHTEVIKIIQASKQQVPVVPDPPKPEPEIESAPEPPVAETPPMHLTISERLESLPGRPRVFYLDNKGNFNGADISKEFKKNFSFVLKNLAELINIFAEVPGVGLSRERGVYEVERNVLYLVSSGTEMYFVYIKRPNVSVNYEREIKAALKG